jgi:uncharacterized protein YtpQ (UPF0354 family)
MLLPQCSADEFVLLYCKLLQDRLPGIELTHELPMTIKVHHRADNPATVYLDNLWRQIRGGGDGGSELIDRHLNMAVSSGQVAPQFEMRQIVPSVKDSEYLDHLNSDSVSEHLVADLWIVYVVDWPDKTVGFAKSEMETLKIRAEDLRQLAVQNLKCILPQVECHGEGPWFFLKADGTYEASLLLLEDLWEQLDSLVDGDLVAVAPSRDVLLFTGSSSREGLTAIRSKAAQITTNGDHVVSSTLLRRYDKGWIPFD